MEVVIGRSCPPDPCIHIGIAAVFPAQELDSCQYGDRKHLQITTAINSHWHLASLLSVVDDMIQLKHDRRDSTSAKLLTMQLPKNEKKSAKAVTTFVISCHLRLSMKI